MANFDLLVIGTGGKQTRKPSSSQTIDFTAVRIGASNLAIAEDTGKFDFDAKVLGNIASGTSAGQALSYTQRGAANGVASLDGSGKVPVSQLPSAVMTYEGTFDASDTPASPLLNGDGAADAGMVYRASVAGTYDFGAGGIAFGVGDYAIYNSSNVWEKSDSTDAPNTDAIPEGVTNLYFTTARARTAVVTQVITNGVTATAPSEDAVFDALAGKSDTGHTHVAADVTDFTAAAKAAAVADAIVDSVTDVAPSQNAVFDALALKANAADIAVSAVSKTNDNAGSITVRQAVYVKSNGNVDLAAAAVADLEDGVIGLVKDASIATTAAGLITFAKGDIISGFSGLTPGKKYYVSKVTPGAIALYSAISYVTGDKVCRVGKALSATVLEFDPCFEFEY